MLKIEKHLIFGSLVVGFLAYNLWPFLWHDVYYQGCLTKNLMLCAALIKLSDGNKWLHKGAWMAFWMEVIELLDECGFYPMKYEIFEYVLTAAMIYSCIVGETGLYRFLLWIHLNFNRPIIPYTEWKKQMSLINIEYPLKNDFLFSKVW